MGRVKRAHLVCIYGGYVGLPHRQFDDEDRKKELLRQYNTWKQLLCCKKRAAKDLVNKNLRLKTAKTKRQKKEEAAEDSDEKN